MGMKIIFLLFIICLALVSQQLYEMPMAVESRLSSFENLNGIKGQGGKTNKTSKGNAWEWIKAGEIKTLMDVKRQGIIQRLKKPIDIWSDNIYSNTY